VLATLSRWRPRVRIPPGALDDVARCANRQSAQAQTLRGVGSTPTRATRNHASDGTTACHRTVTPGPSGTAGSIPARRTGIVDCRLRIADCPLTERGSADCNHQSRDRQSKIHKARSSSGTGRQPLTLVTRVRFPHGSIECGTRNPERGMKARCIHSALHTPHSALESVT
jgi:hypothetical protein